MLMLTSEGVVCESSEFEKKSLTITTTPQNLGGREATCVRLPEVFV
jgi:hypothetical protein